MSCRFAIALVSFLLPIASWAANWADTKEWPDMKESKEICRKFLNITLPAADQPNAKTLATLGQCDSESLYYGIDRPVDAAAARACAFAERDRKEEGPFAGKSMLMTIYANGVGAERRLDIAIALACTLDGAPAEMDGRVKHLYQLMQKNWSGRDFSWCDDITSGMAQGYCADHEARKKGPKRATRLAKLAGKWASGPAKARFAKLNDAVDNFIEKRGENEISPLGTAHAALTIEEGETLHNQFVKDLEGFARGKPPCKGAEKQTDADAKLNAVYRKIQQRPAEAFMADNGNVEQAGIKKTQLAWLKYRDAWTAFVAAAYPEIPAAAVINWLTQRRVKQLEEFTSD